MNSRKPDKTILAQTTNYALHHIRTNKRALNQRLTSPTLYFEHIGPVEHRTYKQLPHQTNTYILD